MYFLHAGIQRSQKVLMCIPLQEENTKVCKILLIYHDWAQVLQVDNSQQTVTLSSEAHYPLTVPIVWCCIVGSHIAAVTRDGHLLVLESTPPFTRAYEIPMAQGRCPMTLPVAHCAVGPHGECIVASGFTKMAGIAQFDSVDRPSVHIAMLPDFFVLGVAATQDPSVFAFLVAVTSGRKFVVLLRIDVPDNGEESRVEVPRDSIMIDSIFDDLGYSKLVLFTETELRIQTQSMEDLCEPGIPLESQVYSWFVIAQGELIVQCLDTNLYGVSFASAKPKLILKGRLPLISTFCCLENGLLFCVSESGDSFFLPLTLPSSISFVDDSSTVDFDSLPKTLIPMTPRITSAFFNDRRLLVSSGGGETKPYVISSYLNTLPFTAERDLELSERIKEFGSLRRLFCLPDGLLVGSSKHETFVLNGSLNVVSDYKTLALGSFANDYVQIHEAGIKKLNAEKEFRLDKARIVSGSIGQDYCIAAFTDNFVRLFDKELDVVSEARIPGVHAVAVCNNYLALACDVKSGGNPTLSLYSHDLRPYEYVGQLTGRAYRMVFVPTEMELYVATVNGSVSRWIIGDDFSNSCAEIYVGKKTPMICPFDRSIFISCDGTYLFSGQELLSLHVDGVKAMCPGRDPELIYVINTQNDLLLVRIMDTSKDLMPTPGLCPSMPRAMTSIGSRCFAITRSRNEDQFCSSLVEIRDTGDEIQMTASASQELGPVSIIGTPQGVLFTGFATRKNNGVVMVMSTESSPGPLFRPLQEFAFDRPPLALAVYGDAVLAGIGRRIVEFRCNEAKEWSSFENLFTDVPTQVAFIETSDNFIWVGDRTQSVFCFLHDPKKDKRCLVACDPEPRQLTAMSVVKQHHIAVGDKFGKITVLRLPDEVAYGSSWSSPSEAPETFWAAAGGRSTLPDRGLRRVPVCHLIKVSVFCVNDVVTSVMVSKYSRAIFYTTLLGKIGCQIPLSQSDFQTLASAELLTLSRCTKEFGLTILRKFDQERVNVVDADILDHIQQLQAESQKEIEGAINMPLNALVGRLCRFKCVAKF